MRYTGRQFIHKNNMSQFFRSQEEKQQAQFSGEKCEICNAPLSVNVLEFSTKRYGRKLCFKCQQKEQN